MNRVMTSGITTSGSRTPPASFFGADLRDAQFMDAQLEYADFVEAQLSRAVFIGAQLNNANFASSDLTGADFSRADMTGVLYEPRPGALPTVSRMTDTYGLGYLTFVSPHGVAELREAFKKGALRDQERELTYALKRNEVSQASLVEKGFNWILFDATSQYGMSPGRPLWILLASIGFFAVPYLIALHGRTTAGIWVVWPKDRLPNRSGTDTPQRLMCHGLHALQSAFYFSLLSAASIGWRDLNVGSWLVRIQADEYSLKPTGWVRTISGIQSLLSVYLLALWALTYFGRPFE